MAVLQREISLDLVYRYLLQAAPGQEQQRGERGREKERGAAAAGGAPTARGQALVNHAAAQEGEQGPGDGALPARFALAARFPAHRWQEAMRAFAAAAHRSPAPTAGAPPVPLEQRPAWRAK